jgi:hypothetical protein
MRQNGFNVANDSDEEIFEMERLKVNSDISLPDIISNVIQSNNEDFFKWNSRLIDLPL